MAATPKPFTNTNIIFFAFAVKNIHIFTVHNKSITAAAKLGENYMFVTVIRTILLYMIIIISLRIMGKRQISEMQPTELVCTILISNIATLPIEDANIPFLTGVIPIFTIICLEVFISVFSAYNRTIKSATSGNPCIVITGGKIDQKMLSDLRITAEDLLSVLHSNEIFDPRDVIFAAFETNGKLALYKKAPPIPDPKNPPKPKSEPPMPIVVNGQFIKANAKYCKADKAEINKILAKEKTKTKEVFLMLLDPHNKYYIIKKGE